MFAQYSLNIWLFRLECWMEMATSLVQWHGRWKRRQASETSQKTKQGDRVTSQTATGDVKFYLGDILFFYGTIWFTQTKPCQLYLCNDFHELSTGIKSCFDPTLWTRIEDRRLSLWKMGGYSSQVCRSFTRGFRVSFFSKWLNIFVKRRVR